MPLNFPPSPLVDDFYSEGGRTWVWTGIVWRSAGTAQGLTGLQGIQGLQGLQGPNAAVSFGITPPVSPLVGDRWIDSETGIQYTWINDGNNTTWVEVNPAGFSGTQGLQGAVGSGAQGLQGLKGPGTYTISPTKPLSPNTGDTWLNSDTAVLTVFDGSQWAEYTPNLIGAQGIQGLQGTANQGVQGLNGAFAAQGIQGIQGATGVGLQGTQGVLGNQGLQGINNALQGFSLQNTGVTTNYTLQITDKDMFIQTNNSSANTVTIPLNLAVPFPIGSVINVAQIGAGQTSIVATGGVTVQSEGNKLKLFGQYAVGALVKTDTNTWLFFGNTIV